MCLLPLARIIFFVPLIHPEVFLIITVENKKLRTITLAKCGWIVRYYSISNLPNIF